MKKIKNKPKTKTFECIPVIVGDQLWWK